MKNKEINKTFVYLIFYDIGKNQKFIKIPVSKFIDVNVNGLLVDSSDITGITSILDTEYKIVPITNEPVILEFNNILFVSYNCKITTADNIELNFNKQQFLKEEFEKAVNFGIIAENKNYDKLFIKNEKINLINY